MRLIRATEIEVLFEITGVNYFKIIEFRNGLDYAIHWTHDGSNSCPLIYSYLLVAPYIKDLKLPEWFYNQVTLELLKK